MLRILAFLISFSAYADDCHNRNGMSDYRDLIHQAAVIDEDGRQTEEQYAKQRGISLRDVQNRFAATGVLRCDGIRATAQLTGATNVITTAAHVFHKGWTCTRERQPESCTFTVKIGGREQVSKIKSSVIGYNCPQEANRLDDWAVLTLDRDISGANPYEIPQSNEVVRDADQIISTSAGSSDFTVVDSRSRQRVQVKTIDECTVKRTVVYDVMARFESDCDGGPGISGGGILKRISGKDVLMGITTNSSATLDQERDAARTGNPVAGRYSPASWASFHLPLTGQFLKAVEKAVGAKAI